MKRFIVAALAALLLLPPPAIAQDDQYLGVYALIQEADQLKATDQPAQALGKYIEAQSALSRFQRIHPEWNTKVVNYRLSYVASRINELSSRVRPGQGQSTVAPAVAPAAASSTAAPVQSQSAASADFQNQLNALQNQLRQLQSDKSVLEAKLKEALAAQPVALDPRELARAQDQIKFLQKENDLLKVDLSQQQAKAAPPVDARELDKLKKDLAEANRRLTDLTDKTDTLTLEKKALQNKLNSLLPEPWNETNIVATQKAIDEANRKLAAQTELTARLTHDKEALEAKVTALTPDAEAAAALRAENEILKKQVADFKAVPPGEGDPAQQLAAARAQVAALQSDIEVLRQEKLSLENQLKAAPAAAPAAAASASVASADAARVKQLERQRDDLERRLEAAQRDLAAGGRGGKNDSARIEQLGEELIVLRTRIGILEAQAVPYTAEELALFKPGKTSLPDPKAAKSPAAEPPPGSVTLLTEARHDFAERRFDEAEQKYLQVLKQDEKNVYTLANLAAIQVEMNRLDDADKNLKQALEIAPNDAFSLSLLGYVRFRQQKYDDALDLLGRAASLDPHNAQIQNYLGLTLSQKGMRVPAEAALRKAVEIDPNFGDAHFNLAVIYLNQKPPAIEMARLHYKKAITAGNTRNADFEKLLDQASAAPAAQAPPAGAPPPATTPSAPATPAGNPEAH